MTARLAHDRAACAYATSTIRSAAVTWLLDASILEYEQHAEIAWFAGDGTPRTTPERSAATLVTANPSMAVFSARVV